MAADDWRPEDSLGGLNASPYRYDFFAALRMVDCCSPESPRTGWSNKPSSESLRLRQEPSMEFSASALKSALNSPATNCLELSCNFLGFFGPQGALPLELTEYALARIRDYRDETFVRFLDCFNHRMLSFFYRSYAAAEPTIQHDRPEQDRFRFYVGSFAGFGSQPLRERDAMPDLAKLHFAGHLGQQNHHADGLQLILADFFDLKVEILQFVGTWLTIPTENRLEIGVSPETGSLGLTTTIGEKIWECQQTIRIVFGPMPLNEYEKFLPGNCHLPKLDAIIKNYAGLVLDWEAQILVEREQVPQSQLGVNSQLGWVSWLTQVAPREDADDLVLMASQL
ncbi:MAG: type VI secretion system protein ImpH [Mariniblastus sp.]|jgi:type VI secretion system protein ImpH